MSATIYVAEDGNWGSAEPGELVVLYNVTSAGIEQLSNASDSERWELAQEWAAEQENGDPKCSECGALARWQDCAECAPSECFVLACTECDWSSNDHDEAEEV